MQSRHLTASRCNRSCSNFLFSITTTNVLRWVVSAWTNIYRPKTRSLRWLGCVGRLARRNKAVLL